MKGLGEDSRRWRQGVGGICTRELIKDGDTGRCKVNNETALEVQDRRTAGLMARPQFYRGSRYSSKLHSEVEFWNNLGVVFSSSDCAYHYTFTSIDFAVFTHTTKITVPAAKV